MPIELVSHEAAAGQLVADGLARRPELAQSHHLVAVAEEQLNRERYAPLLPNVLVDVSQSGFGGGPDSTIADFRSRFDFDATAYWQLRNFGAGDFAARDAARSRLEQARFLQQRLVNQVAREIVEAHAQSESLRGQIGVAESGIRVAADSYRRNVQRIRGGQGLPLEALTIDPGPRSGPAGVSPRGWRLRRVAIPSLPCAGLPHPRGNSAGTVGPRLNVQ